jgi:uncharacterized protein (DUF58 family)
VHLARRAYLLAFLTAVLAVDGIWSPGGSGGVLWRLPLALLLAGLAIEALYLRRIAIGVELTTEPRAFLGRAQRAVLTLSNPGPWPLAVEYAAALPEGFEPLEELRRVEAPARGTARDELELRPVRLGPQPWPELPARVRGPLQLAWWTRPLRPVARVVVAPDTLCARPRARRLPAGERPRRIAGAGGELFQLRAYVRGDPLGRIDWKATVRAGTLVSRDYSEDQHLDILVAVDAGRFSRVRTGALDRFGVYANLAARFAEIATRNDDRVGLVVYAERVLAACAPARGLAGVTRVRRALESLTAQPGEADPLAAAVRIRAMLRHRALVVLLTDPDDASSAEQLPRALRLLAPPHLAVVAGVRNTEIAALAQREARSWQDPWVALAAAEHEQRSAAQRTRLERLGAPVVSAPAALLEGAVFAEYEALRRSRRV